MRMVAPSAANGKTIPARTRQLQRRVCPSRVAERRGLAIEQEDHGKEEGRAQQKDGDERMNRAPLFPNGEFDHRVDEAGERSNEQ